jgi:hypothetical protein
MAQIVECLPSKHGDLIPSTTPPYYKIYFLKVLRSIALMFPSTFFSKCLGSEMSSLLPTCTNFLPLCFHRKEEGMV